MKKTFYWILCICISFQIGASKLKAETKMELSKSERTSISNVRSFIQSNWTNTIRTNPKDNGTFIGLPYPYTVPCVKGNFQEMYYWDTYFTNIGLILDGNVAQAQNNCEDMLYLVDRFGFMPNGNRTWFLDRSQPPYLSMMIRDVFNKTKDVTWLKKCLPTLEKEYAFWMTKRMTHIGLNHYSNNATDQNKMQAFREGSKRLGLKSDTTNLSEADKIKIGSHFFSECESGWDYNPRFENRCEAFCPVDLNSNLYMYEMNFAFFYSQIQPSEVEKWKKLAEKRKGLIDKYLFNSKDGLFYDYDFVNRKHSTVYSAAVFSLLWSKVVTKQQAKTILASLPKLEYKFGVAACNSGERNGNYQWDYPNGWPCIQFLTVKGLQNYRFDDAASRIAYKYTSTASHNFEKTKNLWEKYNITDGSIKVKNEYEMPAMMGWTAGVFVYMSDYLLSK